MVGGSGRPVHRPSTFCPRKSVRQSGPTRRYCPASFPVPPSYAIPAPPSPSARMTHRVNESDCLHKSEKPGYPGKTALFREVCVSTDSVGSNGTAHSASRPNEPPLAPSGGGNHPFSRFRSKLRPSPYHRAAPPSWSINFRNALHLPSFVGPFPPPATSSMGTFGCAVKVEQVDAVGAQPLSNLPSAAESGVPYRCRRTTCRPRSGTRTGRWTTRLARAQALANEFLIGERA